MKFDDSYKDELDKYTVSRELNEKTLALMEETEKEARQSEQKSVRKKNIYFRFALGAAAVVILFISIQLLSTNNIKIISDLNDNIHVSMVELSDGELNFYESDLKIEITDKFGELNSGNIYSSDPGFFSGRFLIPDEPKDFDEMSADYKVVIDSANDAEAGFYRIIFADSASGAEIQIFATEMQIQNNLLPNSVIKDIPMFLEWEAIKQKYNAEFFADNIYYNITSTKTTQKEFIEFLINLIN